MKKITDFEGVQPLYHQYAGQHQPQPAYIEIDLDNETISASYNAEIGNAVPFTVWHGIDRRYSVRNTLTLDEIIDLFERLDPLADQLLAGYTRHWDGNNHVAQLTPSAIEADEQIQEICEFTFNDDPTLAHWNAGEWLDPIKGEIVAKLDEEGNLGELAQELVDQAFHEGAILDLAEVERLLEYYQER